MANHKDGKIKDGSSVGPGRTLFNVKKELLKMASGKTAGRVSEFTILGTERELNEENSYQ